MFVWYLKERSDLKIICYETNGLTGDELVIRDFLVIRNEHSSGFKSLKHA